MADIAMCDNQQCDARVKCCRATAETSAWQSWEIFKPRNRGARRNAYAAHEFIKTNLIEGC